MRFRKEYIGLLAVIAVLSLYIVFRNSDRTHYKLPVLDAIKRENVTKMVFSGGGESVVLERADEKWNIIPAGYPVDKAAVDRMLDVLEQFRLMTLVAESRNYSLYDLEGEKRIILEVYSGTDVILALDIGKAGSTRKHTFVRLESDDDIYQANGNLRQVFDTGIDKLRDKTAVELDKEQVSGLTLMTTEGVLELTKGAGDVLNTTPGEAEATAAAPASTWMAADGRPADEKVVDQIVNALVNLKCESYIEGRSKEELGDPLYTVIVKSPVSVILSIYAIEGEKYPAFSSQNGYPFYLPKWRAEQIMKSPSEIIPGEASEK